MRAPTVGLLALRGFCFYAAPSGETVSDAVNRAGLRAGRIVEAIPTR